MISRFIYFLPKWNYICLNLYFLLCEKFNLTAILTIQENIIQKIKYWIYIREKTHTLLHMRTQNSSLVLDFHMAYWRLLWELSIYGSYVVSWSAMTLTLSWTLKMLCKRSILKTSFVVCNWVFKTLYTLILHSHFSPFIWNFTVYSLNKLNSLQFSK